MKLAKAVYRRVRSPRARAFAYRAFARLVRNRRVVSDIEGIRLELDLGEMIDLSLWLREYEPEVRNAIDRLTRPGMTVVDIGANIGAHSILFAQIVGPKGRVICFEPTTFAFDKLERNISLNSMPQLEAVRLALSDSPGEERLVDFRASWRTDGSRLDGSSLVPFETLDRWVDKRGLERIDIIKIDVDGNELAVIRGARSTLERHRPLLLMEAVGIHFDEEARNPYLILRDIGYRFWDLKTMEELAIDEMRRRLPRNDLALSTSFNVLARADG